MRRHDSGYLEIRTPEGIAFRLQLASPYLRFLAWVVDMMVVATIMTVSLRILGPIFEFGAYLVMFLGQFFIQFIYSVIMEWFCRGRTLGKLLLRLRVVDEQGLRLQFNQVVVRNLMRALDSLAMFYAVGGLVCLLSRKNQRLGDIAAGTIVIRHQREIAPATDVIKTEKYNSLRAYPHLVSRLRRNLTPEETALALRAVVRRHELDPEARLHLFEALAVHYRAIVTFPEEATVGLTDEQYVRNLVDVLFIPSTSDARGIRAAAN